MTPWTRQRIRTELVSKFCGCGDNGAALDAVRNELRRCSTKENKPNPPDTPEWWFLAYYLSDQEWTEHGVSIQWAWLRDDGEGLLAGLERESEDDYEGLLSEHCACGVDLDDETHECGRKQP